MTPAPFGFLHYALHDILFGPVYQHGRPALGPRLQAVGENVDADHRMDTAQTQQLAEELPDNALTHDGGGLPQFRLRLADAVHGNCPQRGERGVGRGDTSGHTE